MANNSGIPNYPSAAQLQQEALALAKSAVPTKRSITRQYGQQIGNAENFTTALAALLQKSNPGAGYDTALTQQQGVDSAAQARLAALGGQYGAGSAAAVGGIGDSAMSSLIARGAAAKSYAQQLPQVAAARGQLLRSGLVKDENTALQTRADNLRQAYAQTLQQVQQDALARSVAAANIGNQRAQLALSQQSLGLQAAQFAEGQRQFNLTHSRAYLTFQAQLQAQVNAASSGTSGPSNPLSQYTPGQVASYQKSAYSWLNDGATGILSGGGQTVQRMLQSLLGQGIPKPIALYEVQNAYQGLTPPPAAFKQSHPDQYRAALRAYNTASRSFRMWVNQRQWRKKHGKNAAPSSNQPVSFGGGPH